MQLCAGLKSVIYGTTHAVGQQRLEMVRRRRIEEAAGSENKEEKSENVEGLLNNLSIEMVGTEEEAAERLEVALQMEFDGDGEGEGEGEEGGVGTQRSLGDL